jgi:hypothetical protein
LVFAKTNYGFPTIYGVDETVQNHMNQQWKAAVAKAYNLPVNGSNQMLMEATLNPQPVHQAIKLWSTIKVKA